MKKVNIFLMSALLNAGCQDLDRGTYDVDEIAELYDEMDTSSLEGAPSQNPQEIFINEPLSFEEGILEIE